MRLKLDARPVDLLPTFAFAATFGVFFVDKNREARTVFSTGRGVLALALVVAGYAVIALVVRRAARRAWVAPVVLAGVVLGLAAWIVRPYYVDTVANQRLVADPLPPATESETPPLPVRPESPTPPEHAAGPVVVGSGPLDGIGHHASGAVALIRTAEGSLVVRLGDFEVEGVPDPRVYLVEGEDVERAGGTDLGSLPGNRGSVLDIAVPTEMAAGPGWTVLVWCRAFSVPVANATLGPPGN